MGQKVNPHGLRVGVIKEWDSKWYAEGQEFVDTLKEDYDVREFIKTEFYSAGISRIYLDRRGEKINVNIFTAKPGMLVGRGGSNVKELKAKLEKMTNKSVKIDISEVQNPESDAQLIAENVAFAIERRISFRRAMKKALGRAMRFSDVEGMKILVAGRLNGADMARSEGYSEGNVPLSTLRADINYGFAEADTTYGKIGVKVWLNKGEIIGNDSLIRLTPKTRNKRSSNKRNSRKRNSKK